MPETPIPKFDMSKYTAKVAAFLVGVLSAWLVTKIPGLAGVLTEETKNTIALTVGAGLAGLADWGIARIKLWLAARAQKSAGA